MYSIGQKTQWHQNSALRVHQKVTKHVDEIHERSSSGNQWKPHMYIPVNIFAAGREGHDSTSWMVIKEWVSISTGTWHGPSLINGHRYLALRSRIQGRILGVQMEAPQAGELHLWNVGLKTPSRDRTLYAIQGFLCVLWGTDRKEMILWARWLPLACKQIIIQGDLDKKVDAQWSFPRYFHDEPHRKVTWRLMSPRSDSNKEKLIKDILWTEKKGRDPIDQ